MKSYGIREIRTSAKSIEEFHLEEFYNLGYTIIENVLDENVLDENVLVELRKELDRVYSIQELEFGKLNLQKINEENLARIPLAYSESFLNLAARKSMMKYVEQILGSYFVLHLQNGIINMPNEEHHQSSWHRDLPYQNWTSSEPLACNVFYCLDPFNSENGATCLLPFSHNFTQAPSFEYMEKFKIQIDAPAGSAIIFNSMLFHKAGYNLSKNQIRRGVNNVYVKPIISQQINIPELLNGKYSEDEFLRMLLGYKSETTKSIFEYRNQRLNRLS